MFKEATLLRLSALEVEADLRALALAAHNALYVDRLPYAETARAFDAYKRAALKAYKPKKIPKFKTTAQAMRAYEAAEDYCCMIRCAEPMLSPKHRPLELNYTVNVAIWANYIFARRDFFAMRDAVIRFKLERQEKFNNARRHTRIPVADVIKPPLLIEDVPL